MQDFLSPGEPVQAAAAPGRLDVMGGIADYSGATVLQLPLACRTTVSLQRQQPPRVDVMSRRPGSSPTFSLPLAELQSGALREAGTLREYFAARPDDRWAAYVMGVVQWCLNVSAPRAARAAGLRLLIDSDVPEAQGVASSAALEVATMSAVAPALGIEMRPETMAAACHWVENHVVGAPCGIMDQMTSACGEADRLLRLRCQPGTIEGFLAVPEGFRFYGITSGARHAVTGADYETVRTAAFMGYRMIAAAAGLAAETNDGVARVTDPRWHGYLANITTEELRGFEGLLPERMKGADFLSRHGGVTDTVTRVRADRVYPVRSATAHPVREQARILRFASILEGRVGAGEAAELGRLMGESHRGYGDCGLGSEATDLLVTLTAAAGPAAGVYGARITGGGSGGTVAVLGSVEAEPRLRAIAAHYAEQTGRHAELLVESGPGAHALGAARPSP